MTLKFWKLDWKNFFVDLYKDPQCTFKRIGFILKHGTSIDRSREILRALENASSDFKVRYGQEISYLKTLPAGELDVFPYPKHEGLLNVEYGFDREKGLPFVCHGKKRLYFASVTSREDMIRTYRAFVEDEGILGTGFRAKHPHCYSDASHRVEDGDVVVDVGCSEGLFSLDVVERAKRIFVFEMLERWNRPLHATFAPYREKVQIINKLVSDKSSPKSVRLVDIDMGTKDDTYFLKMDIEGWEGDVLRASRDFLTTHRVKISCCTYHRQRDADELKTLLSDFGYSVRFSDGYMLPPLDVVAYPYFRRGMIYARNF